MRILPAKILNCSPSARPSNRPGQLYFYTEQDIQEAARLLTGFGWAERSEEKDPETSISCGGANMYNHDSGEKIFTSAFQSRHIPGSDSSEGMWVELQSFYDMIFDQDETAKISQENYTDTW